MGEAKKLVLKVAVNDAKEKAKALKAVSSILGIESINMDMKEKKLTVVGDIDPVKVVEKLRKMGHTELLTVGPAKEPEKKDDKKDEKKDDKKDEKKDDKKDEKKDDKKDEKKDGAKKDPNEILAEQIKAWNDFYASNPYYGRQYYYVQSLEENPNACVIC